MNAISAGTGAGASLDISAGSVVQGSSTPVVTTMGGRNDANVPISSVILENRDGVGGSSFWTAFEFVEFLPASRPAGTTSLNVEYWTGSAWAPLANYPGVGTVTPTLPSGIIDSDIHGLRYSWSGTFANGTPVSAQFRSALKSSASVSTPIECMGATYDGALIDPVAVTRCDSIRVLTQIFSVSQSQAFSPATAQLGLTPTAMTTATMSVRNTGNVGIDSIIIITDSASAPGLFDRLDLVGFGNIGMPATARVTIEADDGASDGTPGFELVASGLSNGQTVTVPATVDLPQVTAVRLTFTGNGAALVVPNASLSVGLQLALRETVRGGTILTDTTPIVNCVATSGNSAGGSVVVTGNPCATFVPQARSITPTPTPDPGSGTATPPAPSEPALDSLARTGGDNPHGWQLPLALLLLGGVLTATSLLRRGRNAFSGA